MKKKRLNFKKSVDEDLMVCNEGMLRICGKKKPNIEILEKTAPSQAAKKKAKKRITNFFKVSLSEPKNEKQANKDLNNFLKSKFFIKNVTNLRNNQEEQIKNKKQTIEEKDSNKMIEIQAQIKILINQIDIMCTNKIRTTFFEKEQVSSEEHEKPIRHFEREINNLLEKWKIEKTMKIDNKDARLLVELVCSYILIINVLKKCVEKPHKNPFIVFNINRISLIGFVVQIIIMLLGLINFLQNSGTHIFKDNGQQIIQQTPAGKSLSPSVSFLIVSGSYFVFFFLAYLFSLGSRGTVMPYAYYWIYTPQENKKGKKKELEELKKEGEFPGRKYFLWIYSLIKSMAKCFFKSHYKKEENEEKDKSSGDEEYGEVDNQEAKDQDKIKSKKKKSLQEEEEKGKKNLPDLRNKMKKKRGKFFCQEFLQFFFLGCCLLAGFLSQVICGKEEQIILDQPLF